MAEKVRIEFHSEGFHEILCSDATRSMLEGHAQAIAQRATNGIEKPTGEDFDVYSFVGNYGGGRIIAGVRTKSNVSKIAEAADKVLTKAVTG